jgi:hypothetical protein
VVSIIACWHDPKSGAGQCLNDTFRNLFGLLRVYATLWVILASVQNRTRDYRIHQVLIGHIALPILSLRDSANSGSPLIWNKRLPGVLRLIRNTNEALLRMTDESDPFSGIELQEAIDLRWTLRDIRAKRWKLSFLNPSHLKKLKLMNLIETNDDEPALTKAEFDALP